MCKADAVDAVSAPGQHILCVNVLPGRESLPAWDNMAIDHEH